MTDCLIIGFNDSDFASYVEMVDSMGKLNSYLASILSEVGENPEVPIGGIKLSGACQPLSETIEQLESEGFNF